MKSNTLYSIAAQLVFTSNLLAQNNSFAVQVNWNAPIKSRKSIVIHASPEKVWGILSQIDQWSTWMSEVKKSKVNGPISPKTTFDWVESGMKIRSILHTVNLVHEFGWTGKVYGVSAVHNWTLKPVEGGTEVIVEESLEGFLAKLFKKSFQKTLENGMNKSLEELKRESEK